MADPAQLTPDVRAMLDRAASPRSPAGDAVLRAVAVRLNADEQVCAGVASAFRRVWSRIERELAEAIGMVPGDAPISARVADLCLGDDALVSELAIQMRLDRLAAALPFDSGADPAAPSLVARLARSREPNVAAAASAMLVAENDRLAGSIALPAEVERRLIFRVAAAMSHRMTALSSVAHEHRLAGAAQSMAAALEQRILPFAAAERLAAAIDALPDELPALIEEALSDRDLLLLAALLAHALDVPVEVARDLLSRPADDGVWLALRALDLPRPTIARAGVLLSEAEPGGDAERFADTLDTLMRVPPIAAAEAMLPLSLDPDYRAAVSALEAL